MHGRIRHVLVMTLVLTTACGSVERGDATLTPVESFPTTTAPNPAPTSIERDAVAATPETVLAEPEADQQIQPSDVAPASSVPADAIFFTVPDGARDAAAAPAPAFRHPEATRPARYVTEVHGPGAQAVAVWSATWRRQSDLYLAPNPEEASAIMTMADAMVERWEWFLEDLAASGKHRGEYLADRPSWVRVESVTVLAQDAVDIEYCNYIAVRWYDSAGAVVFEGNPSVTREVAQMRSVHGTWYWEDLAPLTEDRISLEDCAWA